MSSLTSSEYEYIIDRVIINAKEAAKEKSGSDFNSGYRLAYYEILDIIKSELEARYANIKDYGLDFKIEDLL